MTIKTKFNIGQEVWFIKDNEPTKTEIVNMVIFVFNDNDIQERYHIIGGKNEMHTKYELFESKEALLKSL